MIVSCESLIGELNYSCSVLPKLSLLLNIDLF